VDVCLSLKHDTTAEARKYKKYKIRKWMKDLNITQNFVCIFCDEISVAKTCQLDTSDIQIRSKCRTIFSDAIPMAKS